MFTGIIHHIGIFKGYRRGRQELGVKAVHLSSRIKIGESLAINGVCLTLIRREKDTLFFNLSQETLQKTTLGTLQKEQKLNLEEPLTLSSPLGGHLVTGHVDTKGKVLKIVKTNAGARLTISFPPELRPYFIPEGSVAINGVSLTIAQLSPSFFEIELIPMTIKNSNLGELRSGNMVNIECDMIGKYMYNWMSQPTKKG